jgi:DNA polymerase-3 subunit chi
MPYPTLAGAAGRASPGTAGTLPDPDPAMPRADFYLIAKPRFLTEPLRLVCELARKANDAGLFTLVLARDQAQAEAGRTAVGVRQRRLHPHQIAGEDMDEEEALVLIAVPGTEAPARPLVINLRDEPWLGECERVLEVVPADPEAREPLRERWRQYKAAGYDLNKHDM